MAAHAQCTSVNTPNTPCFTAGVFSCPIHRFDSQGLSAVHPTYPTGATLNGSPRPVPWRSDPYRALPAPLSALHNHRLALWLTSHRFSLTATISGRTVMCTRYGGVPFSSYQELTISQRLNRKKENSDFPSSYPIYIVHVYIHTIYNILLYIRVWKSKLSTVFESYPQCTLWCTCQVGELSTDFDTYPQALWITFQHYYPSAKG